jgi:hypothetical protein
MSRIISQQGMYSLQIKLQIYKVVMAKSDIKNGCSPSLNITESSTNLKI